jgi:diguanylate cyclase (GGDEF)-like protein
MIANEEYPSQIELQANKLFQEHADHIHRRTDRMFAYLMLIQWVAGIVAAWLISPLAWSGTNSSIHPHVWTAVILGGAIAILPIWMSIAYPGKSVTRHVIAFSQMLFSALLIHLTGGRIETHFHVFGSLAFLAFYRDWRVLVTASVVVAVDHFLRGLYIPQSVFGVLSASPWRALEHAGWVAFEDIFLVIAIAQSIREMRGIALQRAQLEATEGSLLRVRGDLERQVEARTADLQDANEALQGQVRELERAERQIQWQSHHDAVTGLPNRSLLNDRLEHAIAMARKHEEVIGVLFLSIDRFKQITDSMGHAAGEQVLCQVALRLKNCMSEDSTVARIDGPVFAIMLPGQKQADDAIREIQRIQNSFAEAVAVDGHELFVSTSLGLSLFPSDGDNADILLMNADLAMRRRNDAGGNGCDLYSEEMQATTWEKLSLENSLRRAIANQELALYYQPLIDVASGKIIGAEALIRWHHAKMGVVSPASFIPLAEETGLIIPIGQWVLEEAARQASLWQSTGDPLRISVNISARQFYQRDLTETLRDILTQTQLSPDLLDLELTESAIMTSGKNVVEMLHTLKSVGVHLAIDDFGTGYSSFAYLRQFPINILKIDRSFVWALGSDPADTAIIRSIVNLAHSMNLQVVAEGVETAEQLGALQELECDIVQGYLFSRPVPAAEFEELRKQNQESCNWKHTPAVQPHLAA